MKPFFKIIIIGIIGLMISCKTDKNPEPFTQEELNDKTVDLNKTKSRSNVVFSNIKNQKIYNAYLLIKAALVNSESKAVQTEAKKLEALISSSQEDKQLKATSKLITLTKDIKKQRDFFVALTAEIEKLIGSADIKSGEVYKQFCPMAFDGKGAYWLSDSKEIRNPYFGDKMLVCGNVNEIFE